MEIIQDGGTETVVKHNQTEVSASGFNIKDILFAVLSKWYWIVLSLIVTMSVASLYLMKTQDIYTRTISVLIKDDSKGSSSANVDLSEMGIMQTTTNLDNEIFTLKSADMMDEVVEILGLNDVYMTKRGLKNVELYRQSPMLVEPVDSLMPAAYSFAIRPVNGGAFTLNAFRNGTQEISDVSVDGMVGDTVMTPLGRFVIEPAPWETVDLGDLESITYSHAPASAYGAAYAARLKVGMGADKGSIINISISDASIQKAEDILLTLVRVYNERWIQDRNQIAISTSRFINERLGIIERELGNVDSDISSFKSQHLLPNVQAVSSMYVSQSAENQNQIFELSNQIAMAEVVRRELSKNSLEEPLPVNPGLAEAGVQSQIGEYNNLVLDRNQLIASSSDKNPVVKDMTNRMRSMRETIFQSIDNLISSLTARLRSIQRKEATTTGHLAANPDQEKYLLSVERQQKVKESLYLFLLQKREENELSQAFTAYNTRIIAMPFGSNAPTSPDKVNILLIAFVIGLAIPIGIIVLIEMMNTKVRGRKDLEGLAVPFIGEIPLDVPARSKGSKPTKDDAVKAIVVEEGNRNIINEAFRVVRTNLAFMTGRDNASHVNVVTSFNPGSGKSFLAMNIAMSFALKGKKVLVVDGDMRHGSTSAYVGSPSKGMCDFLSDNISDWRGLIVSVPEHRNLSVLPVGTIPPNPTELLESERFSQLIAELRHHYDYIFIDCPPINIVADTQIIEHEADRTIFVIRVGLLERSMLPELDNLYFEKRFKNMSLILNATNGGRGSYSYQYGYTSKSYYNNYYSDK